MRTFRDVIEKNIIMYKHIDVVQTNVVAHGITAGAGAGSAVELPVMRAIQNAPFRVAAHLPGGHFVPATTIGASRIRTHRKQAISNANGSRQDS